MHVGIGMWIGWLGTTLATEPDSQTTFTQALTTCTELRNASDAATALAFCEQAERLAGLSDAPDALPRALGELGATLRRLGRYDDAASALKRSVLHFETIRGERDETTLLARHDLASLWLSLARYADAERLVRSALDDLDALPAPDEGLGCKLLGLLGSILAKRGHATEAEPLMRRAVGLAETAFGPDHPATAEHVDALAVLLKELGHYDEAGELHRRSLAIAEAVHGPDHPTVAKITNNLAQVHKALGQYGEAIGFMERAVTIAEAALRADHPLLGVYSSNLGLLLHDKGRTPEAEERLRDALAITEAAYGPEHPSVGIRLNNLGFVLSADGRHAEAEPLYRRALALAESRLGSNHPSVANRLDNLAGLLERTGRYDEAEPMLRRALAITEARFGDDHPKVAIASINLAHLVQRESDRLDEAEALLVRSQRIIEARFGTDSPHSATPLANLASLYRQAGRVDEAEVLNRQALNLVEAAYGPEDPRLVTKLNNLAFLLDTRGALAEVVALYERALDLHRTAYGPTHPLNATILLNLAGTLRRQGRTDEAVDAFSEALAIEERELTANLLVGTSEQRAARVGRASATAHAVVTWHLQDRPDDAALASMALRTWLRRKGRLQALEQALIRGSRTGPPETTSLLERLRDTTARLARHRTRWPSKPGDRGAWRTQLDELLAARADLERQLAMSAGWVGASLRTVEVADVAATLPDRTALIEFVVYRPVLPGQLDVRPARYAAYVLRRDGSVRGVDLGPAEVLDPTIDAFRQVLLARQPLHASAADLYDATLAPLELSDEVEHLFIAPDGLLNLVSFDALIASHRGAPQVPVSVLTSGRERLPAAPERSRREERAAPAWIVYDVDYDRADRRGPIAPDAEHHRTPWGKWAALDGTNVEGEAVLGTVRRATALVGPEATETALRGLSAPRLLHVASHGYIDAALDPGDPEPLDDDSRGLDPRPSPPTPTSRTVHPMLKSGLVLAGANLPPVGDDDGLLTAAELATVDLWGTGLVTLSACHTGQGELRNGDGVYGLRRALVLAGSRAQVVSLWAVEDRATAALMTELYRALRRGATIREALTKAQDRLRREPRWAHPFFWAAFTLSGDPDVRLR